MQYKIVSEKKSEYWDIMKHEPVLKNVFVPNEKNDLAVQYDLYSNSSKMQKIRMKEIKRDEKR